MYRVATDYSQASLFETKCHYQVYISIHVIVVPVLEINISFTCHLHTLLLIKQKVRLYSTAISLHNYLYL